MPVIDKILKLTAERNISNRKLTIDLGISNSAISEWKKGKAKPSLEAVVKIAKYFGVSTDYLLLEEQVNPETVAHKKEILKPDSEIEENEQQELPHNIKLSAEEEKLLECYNRLDNRDKEYIHCKMVVLIREADKV